MSAFERPCSRIARRKRARGLDGFGVQSANHDELPSMRFKTAHEKTLEVQAFQGPNGP
jgi:hypothetical protein